MNLHKIFIKSQFRNKLSDLVNKKQLSINVLQSLAMFSKFARVTTLWPVIHIKV